MEVRKRKSTHQAIANTVANGVHKTGIGIAGLLASLVFASQLFASAVVNINTADAATIATNLQGIGPVKAQAIVDYRKQYGLFKAPSDIMNVTGIGKATYELLKSYLSVGSSTPAAKTSSAPSLMPKAGDSGSKLVSSSQ